MVEDNKNNDTKEELKTSSDGNDMDTQKINENENLNKKVNISSSKSKNEDKSEKKLDDTNQEALNKNLESMDINSFIEFCNITFKNDKIEGMLYSLVNAYQINEEYEKALKELDMWIKLNPSNQRMINKRQKVLSNSSLQ